LHGAKCTAAARLQNRRNARYSCVCRHPGHLKPDRHVLLIMDRARGGAHIVEAGGDADVLVGRGRAVGGIEADPAECRRSQACEPCQRSTGGDLVSRRAMSELPVMP
jgi:hypothetical protein